MENASKAMLIAGGVLIAIMVISLGVYLFQMMGNFSEQYNSQISAKEIAAFNNNFLVLAGRTDIDIHEIVSIAGLAKENNIHYEIEEEPSATMYVKIEIQGITGATNIETRDTNYYYKLLQEYSVNASYKFTCVDVHINEASKRVDKVIFSINKA